MDRLLVHDIHQYFKLELYDEDTVSSDDLIGVIKPQMLTELLAVGEKECQTETLYKETGLPL